MKVTDSHKQSHEQECSTTQYRVVGVRGWGGGGGSRSDMSPRDFLLIVVVFPTFTNDRSGEVQKITSVFFFLGKELMVLSGNRVDGAVV